MTVDKPAILVFTRYYLPGYKCGPITSLSNLVGALGHEFDFRIVTSDRDVGDTNPYPDVSPDGTWHIVGNAQVLYLASAQRRLRDIARILRETPHDAVYLNSFFDPDFAMKPLLARRLGVGSDKHCILTPRGELSLGALTLKAWKKRPFIAAARLAKLYSGVTWQATSAIEQRDIQSALGIPALQIVAAPNLSVAAPSSDVLRRRAGGEPLRICFLSRISPKKNLHFALEALRHVQAPIRFDIYGPVEDETYWARCRQLMRNLPGTVQVAYRGSVEHDDVVHVLATYDLFFLPTLGENHGHVIYEALAAGTPVLIADTTPWRNLAELGVGWDLPLDDPRAFGKKIAEVVQLSASEQAEMRNLAHTVAEARRMSGDVIEQTRQMLNHAVAPFGSSC